MASKRVSYNKSGIEQLPVDKPVLYRIETAGGKQNYVGIAQRGRVQDRIGEHLGEIPGATVSIERFSRITDARTKEAVAIKRSQPKYNVRGK
jgi:hypothetical protein